MSQKDNEEDWSITILLVEIGVLIGIILALLKILPALAHT
ncbi:hypothetical protein HNQ62_001538 [Sulfurisphaera ohwakuensis]|uniref:Uncharacterized protein n=1 Tax=Sulfurisphaera ohwakuensis TaxID=69656 RepID=A0A7J9RRX9_SULOH|nr:hypothetical protein [Sulfurisphaera ohwakuensis]